MGGPPLRSSHRTPVLATGCITAALLLTSLAHAAPSEAERRAVAEPIFAQAQQAMAERDFATACPKLAEVTRLLPGKIGALLTLAECYEGWGKVASAKAAYEAAERAASAAGDARVVEARDKARLLATRVPRLTVIVPPAMKSWPGLSVRRDDLEMGAPQWGEALPIDPGRHVLRATAPGKKAWSTTVEVVEGGVGSIEVPMLGDAAAVETTPPATTDTPSGAPVKTWVWVSGGAGIALLGVAAGFGIDGLLAKGRIEQHCGTDYTRPCRETTAQYDFTSDVAHKNRGLAVFIGAGGAGAIAIGAAVVGLVGGRSEKKAARPWIRTAPVVTAGEAGWVIQGGF
ncbi:MAG: hypothetical protein U0359_31660 [Byssovorax sp.]